MNNNLQAIILAAGKSTRFHSSTTKLAEPICGQKMILFPTKLLQHLDIPTTVVVGYQQELVTTIITAEHGDTITFVTQDQQNGTGHALACTQHLWNREHILVLNGDVPLITPELITALYQEHTKTNAAISFIISCNPDETGKAYGRVIATENKIAIVEAKDFTGDVSKPYCVNAGIYLINKQFLHNYIATLNDNNASKEFYITDLVSIASNNNAAVTVVQAPFNTIRGINTFYELWVVEQIKRTDLISHWMNNGVRFAQPHQTHVDLNVVVGPDSVIESGVHLRGTTKIGNNCHIKEFSSLENATLEDNVTVHAHTVIKDSYVQTGAQAGPFAHIHSNSTIGQNSIIGNFVEIKKSIINNDTNAKHLTYIGDAHVGSRVNIGAGTITCNFDGFNKNNTIIKNDAFIGSNNTLIAPITIGENSFTAAGSTITSDVPDNALAIARSAQTNKNNYAIHLKKNPHENKDASKKIDDPLSFIGARIIYPDTPADKQ